MPVEEQVVSIYAGTNGYLDPIAVEDVRRFENELIEWFRSRHRDVLDGIAKTGNVDVDALQAGLKTFASQFQSTVIGGSEPDPEHQGPASERLVDSDITLPEEEIERED
jgi:F-type H+/Na+-transporting ATPase subunit alpha